jgi:hypothetical protein
MELLMLMMVGRQNHLLSNTPNELSCPTFKPGTAGYKVRVLQPHSNIWYFELIVRCVNYIDLHCEEYVMAL